MIEVTLSKREIINQIQNQQKKIIALEPHKSKLLEIAHESFTLAGQSHLESLSPEVRDELGLEIANLTRADPRINAQYKEKKNRYLSLGKSYATVSFLFDLVEEEIVTLDILLLQEILMDEGEFRKNNVYLTRSDGSKLEFDKGNTHADIMMLLDWYYEIAKVREVSPIVTSILFHYKLVSLHPFNDGNGRIARLMLNLILLKNGLLPITIPNEKRKEYYDALLKSDHGNFDALIDFFGNLVIERQKRFISIASELDAFDYNKLFLVLTEDGNTSMINKLLDIHGIDQEIAKVEPYDGKDNLAAAIFFAKKLVNRSKKLKCILVHRDRDNDNPQQLKQIIEKHLRNYQIDMITAVLITEYNDIESYFLNERHVNELFPAISISKAFQLIEQATNETSDESKRKLRIAYAENNKYARMPDPLQRASEIDKLYDSDSKKFRYGKGVLWRLEELITTELGLTSKVSLASNSSHIRIPEIEKCRKMIEAERVIMQRMDS